MKHFLIVLLGLISFLSPAQEVVIPADVARYFLEQDDRVSLFIKKDEINKTIISSLNSELMIKQTIIDTYKADSISFRSIIATKDNELILVKHDLIVTQKIINSKDFKCNLFAGGTTGAIIGSAIPAIGSITGGLIGAATGITIYGIKKFTKRIKR